MAPDGEQCERGSRGGTRVLPGTALAPACAWLEPDSPAAESRRLLPAASLQHGLALGVWTAHPKQGAAAGPLAPGFVKPKAKTRSQKRKERIIAALKPPYFILSMIVVMTGVHLVGGAGAGAALEWAPARWMHEPWRLLSYCCVHATDRHLALNALVALAVGWRLEREQGSWRVAAVWAVGAAAGALGAGALQPAVHVVGASAAVYALLTAHLPNVAYRFGHIPLWWFRPLSVVVLAASEGCWSLLRAAPVAAVADSLRAPAPAPALSARAPAPHSDVAWSAHLFGAVVGVPIAFLVFTGENKSSRWVVAARVLAAGALLALLALACAYYGAGAGAGAGACHPAPAPARAHPSTGVRELPPHRL